MLCGDCHEIRQAKYDMRVFAAIKPPENITDAIGRYVGGLRAEFRNAPVKWERPEKLHITLKFIGDMDEQRLGHFIEAVKAAAAANSPFKVQISDAGAFLRPRGPRVLWLGVGSGKDILAQIATAIDALFSRSTESVKPSDFNPHLTIARLKRDGDFEPLIVKHVSGKFSPLEFTASDIVILESELLPIGSVYKEIARIPFVLGD